MLPAGVQAARRTCAAIGVLTLIAITAGIVVAALHRYGYGWDSYAYWRAWRHVGGLYGVPVERHGAYLYSPAFAELVWPLTLLPWALFATLWSAMAAGAFIWLLWPLPLRWRLLVGLLAVPEVIGGNIWWLFAVALVGASRRSAWWAVPLLTKVTAGGVGLVWFGARREWRELATVAAAAATLVGVSFALGPMLWWDWIIFMARQGGHYSSHGRQIPPIIRLPAAAAIVLWAARRSRADWLPVAVVLASPVFAGQALATLAAIPRLRSGVAGGASRRPSAT
jgi:hypothetical protein